MSAQTTDPFADIIGPVEASEIMGISAQAARSRADNFAFFRGKYATRKNGGATYYLFSKTACNDFVRRYGQGPLWRQPDD